MLVDLDSEAVAQRCSGATRTGRAADRRRPDRPAGARAGRRRLWTGAGDRCVVTCFEVVEHLATFVPLLEWSTALARARTATFVISVPNDAFWSIQNPHHHTSWSEGAFEELRRLLPPEQTLLRQVAVAGSAVVDWESTARARYELAVAVGGPEAVPTHFIAAYGPRHDELWRGALGDPDRHARAAPLGAPARERRRGDAEARARTRRGGAEARARELQAAHTCGSRSGAPTSTSSRRELDGRCRASRRMSCRRATKTATSA